MCRKLVGMFMLILSIVVAGGCVAAGQTGTAAPASPGNPGANAGTNQPPINQAAVDPTSGKQLYSAYCALCHGPEGKGGGPFSPQLKVLPPDLTQLLKGNHGLFPEMRVREAIDGEFGKPSHGSPEMPIWGPVFRSMAHGRRDSAQVRINSLVKYLESTQEK